MVINSILSPANSVRLPSPQYLDSGSTVAGFGAASFGVRRLSSFQGQLEQMLQKIKLENERLLIPEKDRRDASEVENPPQAEESFSLAGGNRFPQFPPSEVLAMAEPDALAGGALNLLA